MEEKRQNWAYLVWCVDGSLYAGWTNNLKRRLAAHNAGKGAKYTRSRRPVILAWYQAYSTPKEAMCREAALKKMNRKEKLALIAAWRSPNPQAEGLLAKTELSQSADDVPKRFLPPQKLHSCPEQE